MNEQSMIEKQLTPTTWGWIQLFPQMLRSRNIKRDKNFEDRHARMVKIRDELKKVEVGMKRWIKDIRNLSKTAVFLGQALQTEKSVFSDAKYQLEMQVQEDSWLDKIQEKIQLLDSLIAYRSTLRFLTLKAADADYRLEVLRKKEAHESFESRSARWLKLKTEALKKRDAITTQVSTIVDKFVHQAEDKGVIDLIKHQLQAFKLAQSNFFLSCQKVISGPFEDGSIEELERHWNSFTNRITSKMPTNGGSFESSNNQLVTEIKKDDNYHDSDFDPLEEEEEADFDEAEKTELSDADQIVTSVEVGSSTLDEMEKEADVDEEAETNIAESVEVGSSNSDADEKEKKSDDENETYNPFDEKPTLEHSI